MEDANKEESKKELNKINITNEIESLNNINIHNPDYIQQEAKRKENIMIPEIVSNYPEIKPIIESEKIDKELDKYDIIEKPKERKDIKMVKDYLDKKVDHKIPQIDKLPIIFNYYQLPEIKETEIDDVVSKDNEKENKKVLRGRKVDKKEKIDKENVEEEEDKEGKEEKEKYEINKINVKDNITPSDTINLHKPNYSSELKKGINKENNIPKIINYSQKLNPLEKKSKKVDIENNNTSLNIIKLGDNSNKYTEVKTSKISNEFLLDIDFTFSKNIHVDKPKEHKEIEIISEFTNKSLSIPKTQLNKLPIIHNYYEICLPSEHKKVIKVKNTNVNEKMINNKNKLKEDERKIKRIYLNNKLDLPKSLNSQKINQMPKIIKKLDKYVNNENLKEIKDMKIDTKLYDKKLEKKYFKKCDYKLPIIFNFYQIPEIKEETIKLNTIQNENIIKNDSLSGLNEIIKSKIKNKIYLPKTLNITQLKDMPTKLEIPAQKIEKEKKSEK